MKICDFTVPELDMLLNKCNFTKDEKILFELRAKDVPLEQCAEIMNLSVSAVKCKSQKVNSKIERIINFQ